MISKIKWTFNASKDIDYWKTHDRKKYDRIKLLIKDIQEHPFAGIGKCLPTTIITEKRQL